MANAFKLAQEHLGQRDIFICNALLSVADDNPSLRHSCSLASAEVQRRIHPHTAVGGWLSDHCEGFTPEQQADYLGVMLEYRKRWLAALVEEFSKEELTC